MRINTYNPVVVVNAVLPAQKGVLTAMIVLYVKMRIAQRVIIMGWDSVLDAMRLLL